MQNFKPQQLLWDDLHLVLQVSKAGSFAAAATELGVSTPTVFRRAKALEARLGTLIFRRDNTGVTLTEAGREAAELATRLEEDIAALQIRIGGSDGNAAGTIRLATVDTLIAGPLMPMVKSFRARHPTIVLELRSGIGMANLRQREADAALRAGGQPPEGLVGRKLCKIAVAVYRGTSTPDIAAKHFGQSSWVVPNDELNHLASVRWLKKQGYAGRAVLRANSLQSLAIAVTNGIGLGVLPCYLAGGIRELVRVGDPLEELSSDLWFLTHAELRHTARIRALSDHFASAIRDFRPLFLGAS